MKKFFAILLLLCFSLSALASEEGAGAPASTEPPAPAAEAEKPGINPFLVVLIGEGLIALNSGMAAASPEGMGALMMLTTPLAIAEAGNSSIPAMAVMGTCYFGLGLYNATVPRREDQSASEIFRNNMIGWHLLVAASAASHLLFPYEPDDKVSFLAVPTGDGALATFGYKF